MNKTKTAFQIASTLVLLVIYILFQEQLQPLEYAFCAGAILFMGIPHGAIDHILHRKIIAEDEAKVSDSKFIGWYVLCMLAYLVVWILFPFKALLLFLVLGVYHFGQEFIENLDIKTNSKLPILFWGALILLMPLFLNYQETKIYITETTGVFLPDLAEQSTLLLAFSVPLALAIYFAVLYFKGIIKKEKFIEVLISAAMWIVIYMNTPFIVGFTMYFVIFHSYNSMEHQYETLSKLVKHYSLKTYLRDISPLTLVSYAGIAFLFLVLDIDNWQQLTLYALVFISLLTLPHMLIFERFYENRQKMKKI